MTELSTEVSAPEATSAEAVAPDKPLEKRVRRRRAKAKKPSLDTAQTKRPTAKDKESPSASVRARNPERRVAISDLPPDRQAEIAGRRLAGAAQRKHIYRPQIPEIMQDIELHTHEIGLLFTRDFAACNEYAVAIDYVARERLTDRAEFNAYLQEFQDALDELSETLTKLHGHYEQISNGGMAKSRKPHVVEVGIQSNRSMQLLELFKSADDILRMVQFLTIYGDLKLEEANKSAQTAQNALARCVKALRNVKLRCFRRIVETEKLRLPVKSDTTIEELTNARRVAVVKTGAEVKATSRKRRAKKPAPILDPAAPVTEPLLPAAEAIAAAE